MAAVKAHSVFQTAMQKFLDLRAPSNDSADAKPALVNRYLHWLNPCRLSHLYTGSWPQSYNHTQSDCRTVCSVELDLRLDSQSVSLCSEEVSHWIVTCR